jgi:hypothetical protein
MNLKKFCVFLLENERSAQIYLQIYVQIIPSNNTFKYTLIYLNIKALDSDGLGVLNGQYLPNSLLITRKRRVKLIVTQKFAFLLFSSLLDSIAFNNKLNNIFHTLDQLYLKLNQKHISFNSATEAISFQTVHNMHRNVILLSFLDLFCTAMQSLANLNINFSNELEYRTTE